MAQQHLSYAWPPSPQTPTATTPTPSQPGFFAPAPSASATATASVQSPGAVPHGRKRGADSPPTASASGSGPSFAFGSPPERKRRRPNLANGFQAMSIDTTAAGNLGSLSPRPWFSKPSHESAAEEEREDDDDDDDDGLEPTRPPIDGDVAVEVLPDEKSPTTTTTRQKRPRSYHRNSSFSSTSPSEGDYESDATFVIPPRPTPRVQASSVEHPPDTPVPPSGGFPGSHEAGPHVELLDTPSKRKQSLSFEDETRPPRSKRRREGMDVDLDALPKGSYGPGWYEPEKDRIIITSLSSPESSPSPPQHVRRGRARDSLGEDASMSDSSDAEADRQRYSYKDNQHLSQPGLQGFTISPSLLTHLVNAQRDQFLPPGFGGPGAGAGPPERGLVLYRPLGLAAGDDPHAPPVVREWNKHDSVPFDDSSRFEEVDDDEDLMGPPSAGRVPPESGYAGFSNNQGPMPMGVDMEAMQGMEMEGGWEAGDEQQIPDDAMEIE